MFDIVTDSACDLTPDMVRPAGADRGAPSTFPPTGALSESRDRTSLSGTFTSSWWTTLRRCPRPSLPSLEDFEKVFREKAAAGRESLCLCFTGKMSGGVGSARNARELVLEDYPQAVIEVVDTEAATVSEGATVLNAAAMRDAGLHPDRDPDLAGRHPAHQPDLFHGGQPGLPHQGRAIAR